MTATASHTWLLRLRPAAWTNPEPVCRPATVAAAEAFLGPGPVGWGVEVALGMARDIVGRVPEHGGDHTFDAFHRGVEATVLLALVGLVTEPEADQAMVAPEAVLSNAELARRAVPLDRVLRGVRLGHAYLHGRLMEALDREPESVRAPEAHRVSELLFQYADLQAGRLAEEYVAERDRWRRSTEAARHRIVEDLLAGRSVDPAPAARTLGYELIRHHAAFVVTSVSPDTDACEPASFAAEFSRAVGGQGLLTVAAGPGETWGWTCWP
ncbi:hypothetical protein GUY61_32660, partial [Streptomyces sp. GC420]|nr:hypothetical protein [Streptomyces sp. GC420]